MTGENGFFARVCDIRDEAAGVKSFALESTDGSDLPEWSPGAHVDLALTPQMNRQYSLCGDMADRNRLRFAVLREAESRGGSELLHDAIRLGDTLHVAAVRNNFPLVEARLYLLVAGGIGITPILAMVRELERQGKEWRLLYGGRSQAGMAFLDELQTYGKSVSICPEDEFGLLDVAGFLGQAMLGKVAYCCGPEALIRAVENHCSDWPEEALQIERFHPKETEQGDANTSFEVELRRSGLSITVTAETTIADALDEVGVHIPRSCNEGTCGTCITKLLDGVPDHRDSFLRPSQRDKNNRIMVCCSRSRTPKLVLDV